MSNGRPWISPDLRENSTVPFVSFPSGKSSDFIGDDSVTGGLMAAGDIDLDGHYVGLNLGFRLRKTENFLNLIGTHDLGNGRNFLVIKRIHLITSRGVIDGEFLQLWWSDGCWRYWS